MHPRIENHEYNLRQFIYSALRWPLFVRDKHRQKDIYLPFLFDRYKIAAVQVYDFKDQLRLEVDKKENGRAFEIDVKDRFLPGLESYFVWYNENKERIKKVHGYPNMYSNMKEIMDLTRREILKYYSEEEVSTENNSTFFDPSGRDPNLWNELGYRLFNYLEENYSKKGKIKFINIYYFLRRNSSEKIVFNMTQDLYKNFVQKHYEIEIKKFAKATYLYEDVELPILKDLERNFLDS